MFRSLIFCLCAVALSSCVSGRLASPDALMRQAQEDTRLRRDIEALSTFAIAKYAGMTDDPQTSARKYASLLRTVTDDPWVAEQAIYSVLRLGDVEKAADLSRKLPPAVLAETELPRLTLAVDALSRGRTEEALSYLRTPWQNDFNAMLGRSIAAWALLEEDAEAAITLQSAAGGQDGLMTVLSQTLAALMKINGGDTQGARTDLNVLWEIQARLAMGVEVEARLMAVNGEPALARQRLKTFNDEVGRHPALVALLQEIEEDRVAAPEHLSPQQGTARALYLATAPQAGQGYGDVPVVYFALAVHLDPSLDAAKALWADVLDNANRRPEAIALLKSIPETSIHHTSAQGQLAWALRREGLDEEAILVAQETLDATDDRNIRVQLADLLQSLGRDGEAEKAFTEIIQADAAAGEYDWRIYYARGAARERLGKWPPAEDDLKTALSLNPDNPSIMNHLGYSWIDRGLNLEEGLSLIEDAVRLAPDSGAITDSLGWAHYKTGNYDRAIFYLERAAALAPNVSEILDHLGDAYWQVGRFKEAGFQWDRALKYTENEDEINRLTKKLEGGLALLAASEAARPGATYP